MKTVHRFVVRVDDEPHKITLSGDPLKVAAHMDGLAVEFWTEVEYDNPRPRERWFRVFGTGHPVPGNAKYWGTTERTAQGLVWHLYEIVPRITR